MSCLVVHYFSFISLFYHLLYLTINARKKETSMYTHWIGLSWTHATLLYDSSENCISLCHCHEEWGTNTQGASGNLNALLRSLSHYRRVAAVDAWPCDVINFACDALAFEIPDDQLSTRLYVLLRAIRSKRTDVAAWKPIDAVSSVAD